MGAKKADLLQDDVDSEVEPELLTKTKVYLFMDMLGVRSAWKVGMKEVTNRLELFHTLIKESYQLDKVNVLWGVMETDQVVFGFESASSATLFAVRFYRRAFLNKKNGETERIWIRGVISNCRTRRTALRFVKLQGDINLRRVFYNDSLFKAINMEKSGFKGMRLLIDKNLLKREDFSNVAIELSSEQKRLFSEIAQDNGPLAAPFECKEVVWCYAGSRSKSNEIKFQMTRRLKWCRENDAEMLQAKATLKSISAAYDWIPSENNFLV